MRASHAEWIEGLSSRIVISIPRGDEPIQVEERDVSFASKVGPLVERATFSLKEMVYRGKLDLSLKRSSAARAPLWALLTILYETVATLLQVDEL